MRRFGSHTTGRAEARQRNAPWGAMLAAVAVLIVGGCAMPRADRTLMPDQPVIRHSAIVTSTSNQPVREAAAAELGDEAANAIPHVERPAPQPVDPGAAALVQAMLDRMGDRMAGADDVSRIGLAPLRNQSRATASEFNLFRERLAALLNRAADEGHRGRLKFICESNEEVHYQMQGTVYLISAGGFDLWEMFLTMTPADRSWTAWESRSPVRVLRQARPGQPQFVAW